MNRRFADRLAELERLEAQAERATIPDAPATLTAIDADEHTDEELLAIACWGWSVGWVGMKYSEDLYARTHQPCENPDYWRRVAERTNALRREQGRILVPASIEQLHTVLDLLDQGELLVQSFAKRFDTRIPGNVQTYHCCWFGGAASAAGVGLDDPRWPAYETLHCVLDALQQQTGGAFCQSSEEAAALLRALIGGLEASDALTIV